MLSAIYNPNVYSFQTYNPYEQLLLQQELQRRRQIEAQRLRRQIQLEQLERRRQYEYARQIAELQRRREMELESMNARRYDWAVENPLEAFLASRMPRSPCARRRSASPVEPVTTVEAKQRSEEEVVQNAVSNDQPVSPVPAFITPTPASESSTSSSEPQPEVLPTPNLPEISASHATIAQILSAFGTLQSDFTFPAQLDFVAASSSPKLAYTSTNAPVHQYEHQLTGLLTQLDAVESYGDEELRRARKEAVKMVERELEELDGRKAETWRMSRSEKPHEAEDSALTEEAVEVTASQPDDEAESKVVATLAEGDGAVSSEETVDVLCVSLPQDAADEQPEESVSNSPIASTLSFASPTPVTPHLSTSPSLPVPFVSENLVDTGYSPIAIAPQSPTLIPTTPTLPSADADILHRTSLSESSGSDTNDSDFDEFVEIDADMDAETMSTASVDEVEQERDLAMMDEWELDF